ncbi:RING-H2 finger protein ATL70-like [Bidens hawaiensis]|uniref:RING-H2 finger protein ATL70-like n=1 Tax=Bidens hawaiensis TaxID=980011 RepID=UPI004049989B
MNTTTDGLGPPYTPDSGNPQGGDAYIFVAGFFCVVVLLLSLSYTSYFCKRSRSQPPPSISFSTTAYDDADSRRLIRLSYGIDEDVLVTFPTFLYSNKGETVIDSSCSICLADYKPADVVRLLPACGHLYHVSCIDTWLKAHPTCPMCRNMPGPAVGVTSSQEV